jgi:hypothetical protein
MKTSLIIFHLAGITVLRQVEMSDDRLWLLLLVHLKA